MQVGQNTFSAKESRILYGFLLAEADNLKRVQLAEEKFCVGTKSSCVGISIRRYDEQNRTLRIVLIFDRDSIYLSFIINSQTRVQFLPFT